MDPDFDLLERWRDGDRASGQELFSRHFPAMVRFFRNKADRAFEDLVQRTFLACVEGKDRFSGRASFRAYLFGIARNVLREHYRAERTALAREEDDAISVHDLAPRASTLLAKRAQDEVLLQALRRLSIDDQVIVELRFWENLRVREIADVMGMPEGTVHTRLGRARKRLDDLMEELGRDVEGFTHTRTDLEAWAAELRDRIGRT